MRRMMVILAVVLVAGLGWHYKGLLLGSGAKKPEKQPVAVEVAMVQEKPLERTLDTVGTLKANESIVVRPEIAGIIESFGFAEGSVVKKGSALVSLDDRIIRAEFRQAEANVKLARQNFKRASELSKTGVASQRSFDDAQSTLRQSEAAYDLAKVRLEKTRIIAPFDGMVGLRAKSPGDFVAVGEDVVTLLDASRIKVDFNIPEKAAGGLSIGQQVTIMVDALPNEQFMGMVYALDPKIDEQGRSIALKAIIPNLNYQLKPGYFARVQLIQERKEAALMIPEEAIVPVGQDSFVFVVEGNIAKRVKVTTGARKNSEVEILSGLSKDQKIVTAGQMKIQDGAAVAPIARK